MSDQQNQNPAATPLSESQSLISILFTDVKTGIDGSLVEIRGAVVGHYVDQEKKKRIDLLVAGLDAFRAANKAYNNCKADVKTLDSDGKVLTESFSKARVDERKKAHELREKINKALTLALEKGDFSKLAEIKSNPNAGKTDDKPDAGGSAE